MSEESYIQPICGGGMLFAGPDAVALFNAIALKVGIEAYLRYGIRPHRLASNKAMLWAATVLTGKRYKRSKLGLSQAAADLHDVIINLRAKLHVENEQQLKD